MNRELDRDEQLLSPLLRLAEFPSDSAVPDDHPDEETLALFAEGALDAAEQVDVLQHLDACDACRETASLLVSLSDERAAVSRRSPASRLAQHRALWLAVAATVLAAVGVVWWGPGQQLQLTENRVYETASKLLREGQFARATATLKAAADRGIESDRLRNLQSLAILKMPGPVALAWAGKLTDFGYEIGGVAVRSPSPNPVHAQRQQAFEVLTDADAAAELEVALNRGYLLLTLDRFEEARRLFQTLTARHPKASLSWLGLGISAYALADYDAAEESFRQSLKLEPGQVAARMNLAMTLEEQGKLKQALAAWQALPIQSLSDTERPQVAAEIEELQRHVKP